MSRGRALGFGGTDIEVAAGFFCTLAMSVTGTAPNLKLMDDDGMGDL